MSDAGWYYARNGQQVGPVTLQHLQSCLATGAVTANDLVWREGFAQWVQAQTVPELFGGVAPASPVPVPPQPYVMGYAQPQAQVSYAGFWKRLAAYLIDWLVTLIPGVIVGFILGFVLALGGVVDDSMPEEIFEVIGNIVSIVVAWLYYAIMESSRVQGTLGKLALGIKVTDTTGQPITFARASGRFFGKILSGLILGIGFIMVAFTERKQGLHDMLANCLVVNRA